jgi:broad specificity phosphatase PhoE
MRWTPYLIIVFTLLFSCNTTEKKTSDPKENSSITTYYFIRHAEKDRSDPDNPDPTLTEEGSARAEQWARYFDTITLDAVYATKYKRTYLTAAPTAQSKHLEVLPYDPSNLNDAAFQADTQQKKVLVVGHSNTTPAFVNKIIGVPKFKDMDDNDNSTLYVVEVHRTGKMVDIRKVPL